MDTFKRKRRYVVIKLSDIAKLPRGVREKVNANLEHIQFCLREYAGPERTCLVIESDWPEYEPTWAAIERRMNGAPAWVGIGPPPVDTVCEIKRIPHGGWGKAIVRFYSSNVIVWDWADEPAVIGKCTAYSHEVECRPIRTPEQIAAEERERAVDEMYGLTETSCNPEVVRAQRAVCAALYDANYRKQVAP